MDTSNSLKNKRKKYRQKIKKSINAWPPDVYRVADCIHDHLFDHQSTMDWWKDECNIHDHNFSSKFAHYVGKPPKKYIIDHRIAFAKILLKETNATVTDISYNIGFRSVSAFCNSFENREQSSASEWRKERKN